MTNLATAISAKLANDYGLFPPMEWIEREAGFQRSIYPSCGISETAFHLANRWQSRQAPIFTKVDP